MKKKLITLTIFFLVGISSVFSQKFYIEKTKNGFELPIIDKLVSENYKITFKRDSANYIIKCIIGKSGMLGRVRGSVFIIDNKSGDLLAKTKDVVGYPAIYNHYANPKMVAMKKIAKKYLIQLVEKHVKSK